MIGMPIMNEPEPLPFPEPYPATEFCITDGPGRLIDFGFETGLLRFDGFNAVGTVYVAPTTTACVTGA